MGGEWGRGTFPFPQSRQVRPTSGAWMYSKEKHTGWRPPQLTNVQVAIGVELQLELFL